MLGSQSDSCCCSQAVYSVFTASAAFFVELHAVGTALCFMEYYSTSITFPFAPIVPKTSVLARLIQTFSGAQSLFQLSESSILTMDVAVK